MALHTSRTGGQSNGKPVKISRDLVQQLADKVMALMVLDLKVSQERQRGSTGKKDFLPRRETWR